MEVLPRELREGVLELVQASVERPVLPLQHLVLPEQALDRDQRDSALVDRGDVFAAATICIPGSNAPITTPDRRKAPLDVVDAVSGRRELIGPSR